MSHLGVVTVALVLAWARPRRLPRRLPAVEPSPITGRRVRLPRRDRSVVDVDKLLAEATDLLVVGVRAGLNVRLAVEAVAARLPGPFGDEMRRVVHELAGGARLGDALDRVPGRIGEQARTLTSTLAAADRYGSPLASALERLAAEQRTSWQRRAEAEARRLPVKLLFPLVLCVLPAFALLTVAPLLAGAIGSLRL